MSVRRCDDKVYSLGTALSATGPAVSIPGGEYAFMVDGTVGASTISLQAQSPNGSWSDVVFWGAAVKSTTLPYCQTGIDLPACLVRMAATGGAPSGMNPTLAGLG